MSTPDEYGWWGSLKHGGVLIAPSKLPNFFATSAPWLPPYRVDQLRGEVTRVLDGDSERVGPLLDLVLERICGFPHHEWTKGPNVAPSWGQRVMTGETVKPRRVWQGPNGATLPVFVADRSLGITGERWVELRLGVGRSKRAVSKVLEWLRRAGQKLAILTNGRQWRLIYAGADFDAWAEWDIDLWFREGEPSEQVTALQLLLTHDNFTKATAGDTATLLRAIEETRKGQAELSASLGENVRRAVELLIRHSAPSINRLLEAEGAGRDAVTHNDVYVAACRLVMRCVVILFAEARGDLLPRENPLYNDAYSLQTLREYLGRLAGGHAAEQRQNERLQNRYSAWPRLVALFRLIYYGSEHEQLPITAYGGGLFTPGDAHSVDPILRAIAAFEHPSNDPHDGAIHRVLSLLGTAKVKVRQGHRNTWVNAPVDFSDLSSEYIGILYEGLLDYELRRAPADEPILFLNFGDQPALPFSRVDRMLDQELADMFGKLGKANADTEDDEDAEDAEEEVEAQADEEANPSEDDEPSSDGDDEDEDSDNARVIRERVASWSFRAAAAAKIISKPPDFETEPEGYQQWRDANEKAAENLVSRVVFQGEWYLVRWGGTRKGSGTYYTRPQLAVPTTHRTLRPLAYDPVETTIEDNGLVTVAQWAPKVPEEILGVKVCDPAMGSGSFLVGALRFLTDALTESFYYHGLLEQRGDQTIPRLADGRPFADFGEEPIPVPLDDPSLEEKLRARLKRYVVERCIYGVDIDPLAVELARLAMWVETMDRYQPFGFLDHKLKCGNSLVGAWTDRVFDYPALALEHCSDAGDKSHNGVHFKKKAYTDALKAARDEVLKPALRRTISGGKGALFHAQFEALDAETVHANAIARFKALHDLPIHDVERRKTDYEALQQDAAFQRLRSAYDAWCAVWFWEPDPVELDGEKLGWEVRALPTAENYLAVEGETAAGVARLAQRYRFFHWELEFPDVFTPQRRGFDAILGNPPWEISKPNSREYFSNIDPLYRSYGKQEALKQQNKYFAADSGTVEQGWVDYNASYKAMSNWASNVAHPYGDGKFLGVGSTLNLMTSGGQWRDSDALHTLWRQQRTTRPRGFSDPGHPFRYQGSADLNTYKMFLEFGRALLDDDGRLGMIVPSGIYSDKGSTELRQLFLNESRWEWLFGFENRDKIFDIHRSFKFGPLIVEKGGETTAIRAAFMRHDLSDWENAEEHAIAYPRDRVEQFSPNTRAILELQSSRDLEILEKIYANSVLLGDQSEDGWGIKYATEFHMTNDSKLFPPRPHWEANGYAPDEYGHWLKGKWRPVGDFGFREGHALLDPQYRHWSILDRPDGVVLSRDGTLAMSVEDLEDVALPLYEGRMIGQFDFSKKGWVKGTGRSADWQTIANERKSVEPQYLMRATNAHADSSVNQHRLAIMNITSATNSRTGIASIIPNFPCNHALNAARFRSSDDVFAAAAVFNSLAFDFILRAKLTGLNLSFFLLESTPVPHLSPEFVALSRSLSGIHPLFSATWMNAKCGISWRNLWAISEHERTRLLVIANALVAKEYGLSYSDVLHLIEDCDLPQAATSVATLSPKGFWRIDATRLPELRIPVLTAVAFQQLEDHPKPLEWMLPLSVQLSEFGLGRDARADVPQPVSTVLGERFETWQLVQDVEESWQECALHATLIHRIVPPPTTSDCGNNGDQPHSTQGALL